MLKEQLDNQEVEKYPLTSYQNDVWTEQCLYKNKPIYNIGGYVDIKGNINYLSFQKAVQKLIGDNDSLRIRIQEHDGKAFQKVLKKIEYKVPFYDFSSKEYSEKFSLEWMQEEFLKPFDFNSNDNLFEIMLIKVDENRYFNFFRVHHIISDGWGHSIIVRELVSNYNEIDNSQNYIEKHSYLEFIRDNKSYRESDKYLKDREFWKDKFKCIPQNIFVRNIKSNKLVFSNRESVTIKRNTYNQIMEYCTKEKCSVFHFFLGVLGTYFSRVSNSKEVVIGVPILNRTKASHKQIVGHFANVIPLKIEVSKEKSFLELMNEIKMELKACYRHQKLSFGEIYTSISKDRDQKLFDITLSYENHNYAAAFNGTKTDIRTLSHRHERNALAVFIREFDEDKDVEINFDYAIDAFEKFIPIENVVTNIKHLVESIIKDSDKNINDIEIINEEEKHRLLVEFNDTKADYPRNKTINELFEKHAEKTPDDIAVVYEDKKMSYKELNERANSLARALREKGVGKDVIVGMLVERSVNMIVGIMGILKAGGAYMPIDPDYPEDRIEYTL
ncbi:AMP-binding enzyme, partial [Clostridium acidisoli DSM 12555]